MGFVACCVFVTNAVHAFADVAPLEQVEAEALFAGHRNKWKQKQKLKLAGDEDHEARTVW